MHPIKRGSTAFDNNVINLPLTQKLCRVLVKNVYKTIAIKFNKNDLLTRFI